MPKSSRTLELCLALTLLSGVASISAADTGVPGAISLNRGCSLPLLDTALGTPGYKLTGSKEKALTIGWSGSSEAKTGAVLSDLGIVAGKHITMVHPAWKSGPGSLFVDYPMAWPAGEALTFRCAVMKSPGNADKGDGVLIRFMMDGAIVKEFKQTSGEWQEIRVDFPSPKQPVSTIRVEFNPGKAGDSTCDGLWLADARFDVSGAPSRTQNAPIGVPGSADDAQAYWNKPDPETGTLPSSGHGASTPELRSLPEGGWALKTSWRGATLEYRVNPGDGFLSGVTAWVDGRWVCQPYVGAELAGAKLASASATGNAIDLVYAVKDAAAKVKLSLVGRSLQADLIAPAGTKMASFGVPSRMPFRRPVLMPYLSSTGFGDNGFRLYTAEDLGLFVSYDLDWSVTNCTRVEDGAVYYDAKTDKSRNPVVERSYVTISGEVLDCLPNIPNPKSPYIDDLAGRFMMDILSGGPFAWISEQFNRLGSYGLRDFGAIVHVWQKDGYDVALPQHMPANESMGGNDGVSAIYAAAAKLGGRVALHQNYTDMYKASGLYDPRYLALESGGKPVLGWFNPDSKVQAYTIAPSVMQRFAEPESRVMHETFGTNADYLDVHSSSAPWYRVDMNAAAPGAGMARGMQVQEAGLFQMLRNVHEGPVWGEGNRHWYWAGLVDGVQAQTEFGEDVVPMVDFDLLKIHPQMVDNGMGFIARWLGGKAGLPSWEWWRPLAPVLLDKYRSQTLAFGHGLCATEQTFFDTAAAVKEYWLAKGIQPLYAGSMPTAILYFGDAGYETLSQALLKGTAPGRLKVAYASGLTMWVNTTGTPWRIPEGGMPELPPYGYWAQGPGATSGTAYFDGLIADYSRLRDGAEEVLYVDPRPYKESGDWVPETYRGLNTNQSISDGRMVKVGPVSTSGAVIIRVGSGEVALKPVMAEEARRLSFGLEDLLGRRDVKPLELVSVDADGAELETLPYQTEGVGGSMRVSMDLPGGTGVSGYVLKLGF